MFRNSILRQFLRLLHLLIVPFTLLLVSFAKRSPETVETFYSLKFYPVIRGSVSYLTRFVPFSLIEISIYAVLAVCAVTLLVLVIRLLLLKKHSLVRFISFIVSLAVFSGYLFFAFYVMWGFNYYRVPVAQRLDLPERTYTAEELYSVCVELSERANELREDVPIDTSGIFCGSFKDARISVRKAFEEYGERHPSFKTDVPGVKKVLASEFLSKRGVSGIYIFLTAEPNVNTNEPYLYLPFSAAHETCHYVGYAREEDANFLAFLVLRECSERSAAYSGYMHALTSCAVALYKADPELYSLLYASYSSGILADLENYAEHYKKYADTDTWKRAEDRNDSYLKFNSQEKGTLSYSEDVGLILRYYDSIGFFAG